MGGTTVPSFALALTLALDHALNSTFGLGKDRARPAVGMRVRRSSPNCGKEIEPALNRFWCIAPPPPLLDALAKVQSKRGGISTDLAVWLLLSVGSSAARSPDGCSPLDCASHVGEWLSHNRLKTSAPRLYTPAPLKPFRPSDRGPPGASLVLNDSTIPSRLSPPQGPSLSQFGQFRKTRMPPDEPT